MITYGILIIAFALLLSLLSVYFKAHKDTYKWARKHVNKRKKVFIWLAVLAGLFLWGMVENAFSKSTLWIIWGVHFLCFVGFFSWSAFQIFSDYKRVQRAIARRK